LGHDHIMCGGRTRHQYAAVREQPHWGMWSSSAGSG
jgi:hypothetical protein